MKISKDKCVKLRLISQTVSVLVRVHVSQNSEVVSKKLCRSVVLPDKRMISRILDFPFKLLSLLLVFRISVGKLCVLNVMYQ